MSLDYSLDIKVDTGGKEPYDLCVWDGNITHNLAQMAREAGFGNALWRPEENNIKFAKDLIPLLEKGIDDLVCRPSYFKKFDATNGWGTHEQLLEIMKEFLDCCKRNPKTIYSAWR